MHAAAAAAAGFRYTRDRPWREPPKRGHALTVSAKHSMSRETVYARVIFNLLDLKPRHHDAFYQVPLSHLHAVLRCTGMRKLWTATQKTRYFAAACSRQICAQLYTMHV